MGIVVGVISATGGSLFSGRSVRLEAAAKVKADAHGFPVEASASLLISTKASASRQLDNNSAEVCPIMSNQFHWKLLSWLFCLRGSEMLSILWLSHASGHGIRNQDDRLD
jgi:hypothetical protein